MKTKAKIYSVIAMVSAVSLLTAVFPVLADHPAPAQPAVKFSQQQVTVTTAAAAPNVTVTTTISCNGNNTEPRLDYLLNSGCGQVVIGTLPTLPHLAVVNSSSNNKIFVQTLPAPPQYRWLHSGQSIVAFETNLSAPLYKSSIYISSSRYFAQLQNLVGQTRETKTLSELQVQRC